MIPQELTANDFDHYRPEARSVATSLLSLLRRLPIAVCPSFLLQIQNLETSFPAERMQFERQCAALQAMTHDSYRSAARLLNSIRVPKDLLRQNWVAEPASFITVFTAYLWSSGQINQFREGTQIFFAALPAALSNPGDRLIAVVIGQAASTPPRVFPKLRERGVLLTSVSPTDVPSLLLELWRDRTNAGGSKYDHWYVDGGNPWNTSAEAAHGINISYPALTPLRMRVLAHMKNLILGGDAGTEAMHDRLSALTATDLNARELSLDPVLQRFYTELFTLSSGPQIFSTSFVQWAGRELMRRAQPKTLLLRYAPRQHHRSFNDMVQELESEKTLDVEGSLRDAEMGAYYALLEAERATPGERITFLAWMEGTSNMMIISPRAPAGVVSHSPLSFTEALKSFT